MRARIAASGAPSVIAGSTRCASVAAARHRQPAERRPRTRSRAAARARNSASRCRPARASSRRDRSRVPARTAATMPSGMAIDDRDDHRRDAPARGSPACARRSPRSPAGSSGATCPDRRTAARFRNADVLHVQRPVEAELGAQFGDVLRRRALAEHRLRRIAGHQMDQREHERRDAEQDRNREQRATEQKPAHASGRGWSLNPRRVISFVSPWRVTPSSCAARARWPPVRASAARTNCVSNVRRARSRRDACSSSTPSKFGGSAEGGTTPRRGVRTASAASTFCNSRTLPGQSYRASCASVASDKVARLPTRCVASRQKCSASSAMSSRRARSGGKEIRMTSRR